MLNSDLDNVGKALKPKKRKNRIQRGQSVRARVGNISEFIDETMTVEEFRQFILKSIFDEEGGEIKEYVLTEEDWKNIEEISEQKYQTWEWNLNLLKRIFNNPIASQRVRLMYVLT